MSDHPLCTDLQQKVADGVPAVQAAFDAYQKECFIERPSEFFALELTGEAGELANIERKRWKGAHYSEEHRADEAADVFISLMNFCNAAGIDLTEAVVKKLGRIPRSRE